MTDDFNIYLCSIWQIFLQPLNDLLSLVTDFVIEFCRVLCIIMFFNIVQLVSYYRVTHQTLNLRWCHGYHEV